MARLFQCIACGNIRLTIGLQMMFTVCERQLAEFGRLKDTRLQAFILIVSIAVVLEVYALVTARAVHDAQRASHSESLVSKLLRGMNDAVVFLDDRMIIKRSDVQLAALLMSMHPKQQRLEGSNFLDLFHPDEQERLLEAFRKDELSREEGVAVNTASAKLRDISGNFFTVELTWAYMSGEAESFLVGIREMGEGATAPPAALFAPHGAAFAAGRNASHAPTSEGAAGTSSSEGSSSGSPPSTLDSQPSSRLEDLGAAVGTTDLRIRSCSPSFALLCGGSPEGRDFREFCSCKAKFDQWWHTVLLDILRDKMVLQGSARRVRFINIFTAKLAKAASQKKSKRSGPNLSLDRYRMFEMEFEATLFLDGSKQGSPGDLGTTHIRVLSRRKIGFRAGCAGLKIVSCDV